MGNGLYQGAHVPKGYEQAVLALPNQVGQPACAGADDRFAVGPGLQNHDAKRIHLAWKRQERAGRQESLLVCLVNDAQDVEPRRERLPLAGRQGAHKTAQKLALGPGADQVGLKAVGRQLDHGRGQGESALVVRVGSEKGDDRADEAVSLAKGRDLGGRWRRRQVDAHGDQVDPFVADAH